MNPRERLLALGVLLVVVLAGGAFLFHQLFWAPLQDRDANILTLERDIDKKKDRILQVEADRPKLDRWRQLSLPADVDLAKREYEKFLSELMRESGFSAESTIITPPQRPDSKSSPQIAGKGPIFVKLPFTVQAHTNLGNLVHMLEGFYRASLLHRIKTLSVQRPLTLAPGSQPGDLDINLTIEALLVTGAEKRNTLMPGVDKKVLVVDTVTAMRQGPAGVALVGWVVGPTGPFGPGSLARAAGQYDLIAQKNIFIGPPQERPTEEILVTRFVHLTDITQDGKRSEAFLYDRLNNRRTRLRAEPGFDAFRVLDDKGEQVVSGRVLRIDGRDVIFRMEKNFYSLHVGQSLEETLKAPLTEQQRKALGLATSQDTAKKSE
jgi:hypothetical protein